ncbi:Short-chain dehydrogenase/reductase SDR [Penicillium verhagenii]|nr:Short-chain dehydrogenase/reductase SDR [Penicillium verhagenii]
MTSTIVLVTGANRGIGKGILEIYLKKPNHTVIAATRDPGHPTSQSLAHLPTAEGNKLHVIKIDATSSTDPQDAVQELATKGITRVDILIANAGICLLWPRVSDVKVEDIKQHVDVNIYGFIHLYQAFRGLLKESKDPKWVTIGSSAGFLTVMSRNETLSGVFSLHNFLPMRNAAYAPTKLVQHWYTKAISVEDEWLNAFPIDPGWVQTDIGNRGADSFGTDKPTLTVEESAGGVVKVVDIARKETHSGKLFKYDGQEQPW